MPDCLGNQLVAVKVYLISVLVIDLFPQRLEFFLIKVIIQRIVFHFRFASVDEHILQYAVVIDRLYQLMNTICHRLQIQRKRRKRV